MDDIDQAQHYAELYRQSALIRHFKNRVKNRDSAHLFCRRDARPCVCMDCGDEIDPARLEAKPDAVCCMDCQNKRERRPA